MPNQFERVEANHAFRGQLHGLQLSNSENRILNAVTAALRADRRPESDGYYAYEVALPRGPREMRAKRVKVRGKPEGQVLVLYEIALS
jgi:hypothetical protein